VKKQAIEHLITLEIPSEMTFIHVLYAVSAEILEQMGFNEVEAEKAHLAVIEAGTNAVRHGNQNNSRKMVLFQFHLCQDKLAVTVSDEGCGFDTQKAPNPFAPENYLKPNGRGILAMKLLMDEVHFNNNGSQVKMIKYKTPS
jgi:serine/threonine-protein kinase RsbW